MIIFCIFTEALYYTKQDMTKQLTNKSEASYGIIAAVLAWFIIIVWWWLLWSNQDQLINILDESSNTIEEIVEVEEIETNPLFIGKEVALSGFIVVDAADWNTYISTTEFATVWLENPEKFGNPTSGSAMLWGTVLSFKNNTFFVTINTFNGSQIETVSEEEIFVMEEETAKEMVFVAPAWLRFNNLITSKIGVDANTQQQIIAINKWDSTNRITINYFQCQKWHANYDCVKELENLQKTQNLENEYKTPEWGQIYRVKKTNQRYASIDNRFWYYISSNSQEFLKEVLPNIDFLSNKFIDKYIKPNIPSICTDSENNAKLTKVVTAGVLFYDDVLWLDVAWRDDANKKMQCIAVIDLNNSLGGKLISVDYENPSDRPLIQVVDESQSNQTQLENSENTDSSAVTQDVSNELALNTANNKLNVTDTSTPQFKLNSIEDPFIYTFNGGYTLAFPSRNISFWSKMIETTLGLEKTKCFNRIDIIDYPNRDLKHENPSASFFACNWSLTSAQAWKEYLYFKSKYPSRFYLMQIYDPSWASFANNTKLDETEQEPEAE